MEVIRVEMDLLACYSVTTQRVSQSVSVFQQYVLHLCVCLNYLQSTQWEALRVLCPLSHQIKALKKLLHLICFLQSRFKERGWLTLQGGMSCRELTNNSWMGLDNPMQLSHLALLGSIVKMLLYTRPSSSRGRCAAAGAQGQTGVAANVIHRSQELRLSLSW